MNKSKGNMYEFVTHTWNPLGGECPHKCGYCSTHKLMRYPAIQQKYSGPPRLVERELTNLGKGNFIFVCAQNDLFAKQVPWNVIKDILDHCHKYPGNQYLFQTKNPARVLSFVHHPVVFRHSAVCTTIETNYVFEPMQGCPTPEERATVMEMLAEHVTTYVTIEPIMDFDLDKMLMLVLQCQPAQVNIGADSGGNNLPEPSWEKIQQLIDKLQPFTKIVLKPNLNRLHGTK